MSQNVLYNEEQNKVEGEFDEHYNTITITHCKIIFKLYMYMLEIEKAINIKTAGPQLM